MKIKKIAAALTAVLLSVGLAGCGESVIPDLTEEEVNAVGEYVAFTMMKYDANHRSRLVDLNKLEPKATPAPDAEPTPTSAPQGMGPTDNTPTVDSSTPVNSYTMEEVIGLPAGVALRCTGQSVCDSYPEDGEVEIFSISASSEKRKLLVVEFELTNNSGQEQSIDILSSDVSFQVTVNGNYKRNALTAPMLLSDLSTFVGTIPDGGRTEAVILVEVDTEKAANLESVSVRIKNGEKTCTIKAL